MSHAHETVRPTRTSSVAAMRFSTEMRFRVPSSSSGPHRPQFDSESNQPRTSASLGTAGTSDGTLCGVEVGRGLHESKLHPHLRDARPVLAVGVALEPDV